MLFSLLGLFSCKGQNVNHISVDGFAAALTPETPVLDVRTAEEFEAGHLRGAENIDWFQPDFVDNVKAAFGKDRPLYVYCRSGWPKRAIPFTICRVATWPGQNRAGK